MNFLKILWGFQCTWSFHLWIQCFISFFPICVFLYSFACLTARLTLQCNVEQMWWDESLCFHLRGKAFSLSLLSLILAKGILQTFFITLSKLSSISSFVFFFRYLSALVFIVRLYLVFIYIFICMCIFNCIYIYIYTLLKTRKH